MDILYTVNKKSRDIMLASLYSIYLNGNLDEINLHIIYSLSLNDILYIEKFLKNLENVNYCFYYFDEEEFDKYNIPKWRDSYIANAHLFFQKILKDKSPEKLLYIDADTICIGDINGLKGYNNYPIYAVKDTMHQNYFQKFSHPNEYFNSGVLYIDVNKWNEMNAEERITSFVNHNHQDFFSDQDILNYLFYQDIGELSVEYNYPPHPFLLNDEEMKLYHTYRSISAEEMLKAKNSAKIYHSYGLEGIKPWTKNNINPFNEIFMEYLLLVNPDFKKENLSFVQNLYAHNQNLYCAYLMAKNLFSSKIVEIESKDLIKKKILQKNNHLIVR